MYHLKRTTEKRISIRPTHIDLPATNNLFVIIQNLLNNLLDQRKATKMSWAITRAVLSSIMLMSFIDILQSQHLSGQYQRHG